MVSFEVALLGTIVLGIAAFFCGYRKDRWDQMRLYGLGRQPNKGEMVIEVPCPYCGAILDPIHLKRTYFPDRNDIDDPHWRWVVDKVEKIK